MSNRHMKDILKVVIYLEDFGLLMKELTQMKMKWGWIPCYVIGYTRCKLSGKYVSRQRSDQG